MGVPATVTDPDDGRSMPAIMLSSVDFPLPDLPTTPTNSPSRISRSTFLSAEKTPAGDSYFLLTWCKEIIGIFHLSFVVCHFSFALRHLSLKWKMTNAKRRMENKGLRDGCPAHNRVN